VMCCGEPRIIFMLLMCVYIQNLVISPQHVYILVQSSLLTS